MKKLISAVLIVTMALTLSSCSKLYPDIGVKPRKDGKTVVAQNADYEYMTPDQLIERADLIVEATFTGKTSFILPDSQAQAAVPSEAYTDHVMEVDNVLKGVAGNKISVRVFGGETDKMFFISISGDPKFKVGRKYLMFLRKQTRVMIDDDVEYYFLIGGTHNCFKFDDNGKPVITERKTEEDKQQILDFYTQKSSIKRKTDVAWHKNGFGIAESVFLL